MNVTYTLLLSLHSLVRIRFLFQKAHYTTNLVKRATKDRSQVWVSVDLKGTQSISVPN